MLVLTVVGGLGIFLLGMKNMSEGLQAVAGAGLRRMIGAVTDNRVLAIGVGTGVTMLIQSSSITTVMVVGFVNSGFMTLAQAIGVIMGANIGTTITGWILVMKIGKFGLPILGFAAFVYLFSKHDRIRYVALAIMGLGMVFFGLELMKNGFAIVKNLPAFEAWFEQFSATTYLGVLKCAMVGCVLTFIVQSSSATLGITISLAVTGVIPFETGAALVLGENIGTTITAFLASFGATVNAKRAAYFHMLFNTLGVAWITALFIPLYMPLIRMIVGMEPGSEPGTEVVRDVTWAIAMTHTIFNITNTILFIPFVRLFAGFLERVVPERAVKEKPHLTSLDVRMLETAVIAIEQSRVEVLRMAHGCTKLSDWLKELLTQEVPDQKTVQKAFHREEVLDTIQDEIVAFMAHLLAGNVPLDVTEEARRQLRMADEYESVSDYLIVVLKSHLKLQQEGLRFPEADFESMLGLHDLVADYLALINEGFERRQPEVITKAKSQGEAITLRTKELRDHFLVRMSEQKLDPQVIVAYHAQLNAYRRVREHLWNVAEVIAGEK
ncbi:MAG: Na/Pi cotransporter family protein [Thermoguttaceae bacterium]